MDKDLKEVKDRIIKEAKARVKAAALPFYKLRSILGYDYMIYYFLLGGRMAGKSYAVTDFYINQFVTHGRPFYWLRLTEAGTRKLLLNNAEKLVDPDLRRRYHLNLKTRGENVYNITTDENGVEHKTLMCKVLALSTFYSDKGQGFFDLEYLQKNDDAHYNIFNFVSKCINNIK